MYLVITQVSVLNVISNCLPQTCTANAYTIIHIHVHVHVHVAIFLQASTEL